MSLEKRSFSKNKKKKVSTTLKLLSEVKKADESILQAIDRMSIHDLLDEKLLIFDGNQQLIYSSLDDAEIYNTENILQQLNRQHPWVETKEGLYDVIGVFVTQDQNSYYGISKAFDEAGYSKLEFLRYILLFTFLSISILIVWLSWYLSNKIAKPIMEVTEKINSYSADSKYIPIPVQDSKDEVIILSKKFNELMDKIKEADTFQKLAIHHISHELKTPISVLVSNFERIETMEDPEELKKWIRYQKTNTKELSEIINLLLELSKTDAKDRIPKSLIRIDELLFDCIEEVQMLAPDFHFQITYGDNFDEDSQLNVQGSQELLKAAFLNLMVNCTHYSIENTASIRLEHQPGKLLLFFVNKGPVLQDQERKLLFTHFFRGQNSAGKTGFGLGLVFVRKIIKRHGGKISYSPVGNHENTFKIILPLR